MNTIKFIIGAAVIGFALMGFITLDPAFKDTSKSNSTANELSMNGLIFNDGFQTNLTQ